VESRLCAREIGSPVPRKTGHLNFPQSETSVDERTLLVTDSYQDERGRAMRFRWSSSVGRMKDGIIDPRHRARERLAAHSVTFTTHEMEAMLPPSTHYHGSPEGSPSRRPIDPWENGVLRWSAFVSGLTPPMGSSPGLSRFDPKGRFSVTRVAVCDLTLILNKIERGDTQAADQLLPLVYGELRKICGAKMANEARARPPTYGAGP